MGRLLALCLLVFAAVGTDRALATDVQSILQIDLASKSRHTILPEAFGANIVPNVSMSEPAYAASMKQIDWPFLRVNGQDSLLGYTFPSREAATGAAQPNWWLVDRLAYLPSFFRGKLLITPGGPPDPSIFKGWSTAPFDILNADDQALYARMVAQIAQHLRQAKVPVTYWGSLNEPNIAWYSKQVSYSQLIQSTCSISKRTYRVLKAIDSSYQVGGADLDFWGTNSSWLNDMLSCNGAQSDYVSYHTFGINTESFYNYADMIRGILGLLGTPGRTYQKGALDIAQVVQQASSAVPIMLTEYNMNSAWQPTDPLQATVTGAVYDALAVTQAVQGGVSNAAVWEAFADQSFGVIDANYNLRPSAYILKEMRRSLPGVIVGHRLSTANPNETLSARAIATTRRGGSTIAIINYDRLRGTEVQISITGQTTISRIARFELSPSHPHGNVADMSPQDLGAVAVPANSVVILTITSS